jgi:hypothetical protein
MTAFVRRAGTGRLADGAILTWSVADGERGRRWRAMATSGGTITHALMLEVDVHGRPSRLELTAPAGLLTLHPGPDRSVLHGNLVTPEGVQHLAFEWSDDHGLSVDGRPLADAVTARRIADAVRVGERRTVPVVAIAPDLTPREETLEFEPVRYGMWRVSGAAGERMVRIDDRGIPVGLVDSSEWPLELD